VKRAITCWTLAAGPDGDRGLVDHDLEAVHRLADRLGHLQHVGQVRRAVLVLRRADRDEEQVALVHGGREVGREEQPLLAHVAREHLLEPRLVDRDLARQQRVDLARVVVDAVDGVAVLRQANAHHQADIPRPDDADLQMGMALTGASAIIAGRPLRP
jgi:hypothetical protein